MRGKRFLAIAGLVALSLTATAQNKVDAGASTVNNVQKVTSVTSTGGKNPNTTITLGNSSITDDGAAVTVAVPTTVNGNLTGTGAGTFTGNVSGANGNFSGNVGAVNGNFSGNVSGVNGAFTGNVSGVDGNFSGNVNGFGGTFSGNGGGVVGEDTGTTGPTVGVFGHASGDNSAAVLGLADGCNQASTVTTPCSLTSPSGITAGVRGISLSPIGYGLRGQASNTTGANFGVEGRSFSNAGTGVFGFATSATGSTKGVWGRTGSPDGVAILGEALANGNPGLSVAVKGFSNTNNSNAGLFFKGPVTPPVTFAALQAINFMDVGEAGWFFKSNTLNLSPAMKLVMLTGGSSNFLECADVTSVNGSGETRRCHIDSAGTFVSGSDFAEALPARGDREQYEAGDVLVMSVDGQHVELVAEPYSRRTVGVYSTRPGVLGADKNGQTRVDPQDLPVAVVGIVPTKVTAENGAIEVGDLLVSSSIAGYAMKGTDQARMLGAVVGKALAPMPRGAGVIQVLVMLR
jgi:hypothetical protein